jgi:polar amino acid transport system substrate-binding protein
VKRTATSALLLSAVLAAVALAGCGGPGSTVAADCQPRHEFPTLSDGVLVVSSYTYAPSTIIEGDELGGIEGALLREVAAMECLEIELVEQAAAGVVPAVQSGRADLAAGDWYRTKERAEVLNLTDPLYEDEMVLVSEQGTVATVDQLLGKQVGTFEGNLWNPDVQALLGGNLKIFPTEAAMFQDLATGRLDVGIDGAAGATNMIEVTGSTTLRMQVPPPDPRVSASVSPGQATWPHTKGNDAMSTALNEDIAHLRETGVITRVLEEFGLPAAAADVGEPGLL